MGRIRRAQEDAEQFMPQSLAWLLIWMGALYQVGFALPFAADFSHHSMLYISLSNIFPMLPVIWAVPGVIALALFAYGIFAHSKMAIKIASVIQLILWFWAFIMYMGTGIYFLALAVALTQTLFWAWNFSLRGY